ncbi:hypothetical protein Bca52824_058921 [Brassica carinata]|uniref:Uncharacterized protein n=1 Tax=Brassica carinata TaxID=52824 RepID=A0A8X7UHR3_BRACI|nr:hypothetical protein Bca52824_058921 [Brassica carinata]
MPRILLKKTNLIHAQRSGSASVSETWSRTKSNRIFTRLLNVTISLQPYGNKGIEMIAGILATLVEMLSFDNNLGPMID